MIYFLISIFLYQPTAVWAEQPWLAQSPDKSHAHRNVLLGEILNHDSSLNSLMILDSNSKTIKYIPTQYLNRYPTGTQKILKPYEQQGGTCVAYAIDDFLLQMHFSNFSGNGLLHSELTTEEGRTSLLADAINQYYLITQHQFSILGILNKYGNKYDFNCRKKIFQDVIAAQLYLLNSLSEGRPVLISFMVGTEMTTGHFFLKKLNYPQKKKIPAYGYPEKLDKEIQVATPSLLLALLPLTIKTT